MQAIHEIRQSLAALKLGDVQLHRNLALVPLVDDGAGAPDYVLLDEALERKLARITEVSADGHVPELAFENGRIAKVLLVDGDELVGAKQNRVLNLSILVRAGQKLVVPVSCVEQGRWSSRGSEFRSAGRTLFAKARAAKMGQVSDSLARSGSRRADQLRVWTDVADKAAAFHVHSPTLAMADVYAESAPRLAGYTAAFHAVAGQRGAVVAIDGKPVGLELFDAPASFARYLERLVRSYALDAMETGSPAAVSVALDDVHRFLASLADAGGERFAALGEGEDIRLRGEGVAGGALASGGRVVHLAAFAAA